LNAHSGFITSLEDTSGEAWVGHHLCLSVDHDLAQQDPVEIYTADKGYDDGGNHFYLEHHKLTSAIRLKDNRIEKKDDQKEVWMALRNTPDYQQGLKERYKIEGKFGEGQQGHSLGRCRYIGRAKFAMQAFFITMALNLKRMVRVLAHVGFKTRYAPAA
jgi:hypothetical protein